MGVRECVSGDVGAVELLTAGAVVRRHCCRRLGRHCSSPPVGQAADFENRQTEPWTNYVTDAFSSACSPDLLLQVN